MPTFAGMRDQLRKLRTAARRLGAFARAEDGTAAVETALVAAPFLLLLFGIIELGIIFLVSASLDNATSTIGRTIRTGEEQTGAAPTAANFKSAICSNFGWLQSDCAANLAVDVETFSSFSAVTAPHPVSNGVFNPNNLAFNPGGPNDIVVVHAYYPWPLVAPGLTQALSTVSGGKALLTSVSTFRNEPYGS